MRHVGCEPFARDAADPRAYRLDRRQQRISQSNCPQHLDAELRPHLGMGRDAAGVVVRCTGDEARPEAPEPRYGGRLSFRFTHCDACILLVSVGDKA
jgi:hypothetical protein